MSEQLKPCPFCGSKDTEVLDAVGEYWARCRQCHANTAMGATVVEAVATWNRRAEPGWIAREKAMPPLPDDAEYGDAYMTYPHFAVLHWVGNDIMSVAFCELAEDRETWIPVRHKVTHWMPLPKPPGGKTDV